MGHTGTRDRSESVFSILETSVFEFHFKNSCCSETVVDFAEICNVYIGKMIIKAAKRLFNSDKICCSYSDLNFGVTFFGTQCICYCTFLFFKVNEFYLVQFGTWTLCCNYAVFILPQ